MKVSFNAIYSEFLKEWNLNDNVFIEYDDVYNNSYGQSIEEDSISPSLGNIQINKEMLVKDYF